MFKCLNVKINKGGFTLVEMMVAVAIFSIVIGAVMGVFVSTIKSQRRFLANEELLDQTSYIMEYMSRSLRMAQKDLTGDCLTTAGVKNNYETNASKDMIRFLNYQNKCQEFFLNNNQLKELVSTDSSVANFGASLPLTAPAKLTVNYFRVNLSGQDQTDSLQPRATIFLDISGKENTNIKIQTSVSQRNLDVQY